MMKFTGKGLLLSSIPIGTVNLDPENDFDITFRVANHLSDSFASIDALFRSANKLTITIDDGKGE